MTKCPLVVLVVDDHPVNRLILGELFTSLGCKVSTAANGEAALELAGTKVFDIVCLDRHMPGLSGDEVVERLDPDQHVLAWTTDLADLPARFNGQLAKPVTLPAVVAACRHAVDRPGRRLCGAAANARA